MDENLEDLNTKNRNKYSRHNRFSRGHPTWSQNIRAYFMEFCKNTNIHGFKYLGERGRSSFEKSFWLIFSCVSFFICLTLINRMWIKYSQTPVFVNVALDPAPVWKVPFPAITICPETKIKQRIYNFTDYYHKVMKHSTTDEDALTDDELQQFADSSLVCDQHLYTSGNKTASVDTIRRLTEVAPPLDEVLFSCKWNSNNESCDSLFTPILTEDGICFTFNTLDRSELFTNAAYFDDDFITQDNRAEGWTLDHGYPKDVGLDTFPRRATSAGSKSGMFLLLRGYKQDLDYVCRGPIQGFKVLLHHPAELPRIASRYFRAAVNQEALVAVKPNVRLTSMNLKHYGPHLRQCFFAEERQLYFFRDYTQQNCQIECLANYTLSKCGCVAYHMPREESTEICGSGSNRCLFEAEQELLTHDIEVESSSTKADKMCDCPPSCTSITYDVETSQADFEWQKVFEAFKADINEFPGIYMTRLTIFFKDMEFVPSEKSEIYGPTEFLANCAGLLWLFTGFSFFSIVEIVYFLSVRVICNVRKYGKHYWSGSNILLSNDS
jgi:amiloride-sensitive sodium channel